MSGFKNEMIINHNIDKVFNVFHQTAKRDFPDFSEETAIGTKVYRTVGSYSTKSKNNIEVEITDFKRNEVYEVTTRNHVNGQDFVSRYLFEKVDDDTTMLTLEENQQIQGVFSKANAWLTQFIFKNRVKSRLEYFVESLEKEIEQTQESKENN